jgi:hypothetical protein
MRNILHLTVTLLAMGAALVVVSPAAAEEHEARSASPRVEADASSYCAWVRAAAASEAAPLVAPSLFVSGGVVGGAEGGDGANGLPPTPRITAGASYSVSNLVRGVAVGDRADADCALYRREAVLRSFVQAYRDGESKSALAASLAVYQAAEPKALEMFERIQSSAASGRATAVDVTEAELRLDDLRSRAAGTRRQLGALQKRAVPPPREVAAALAARPAREADVERELARIRRSRAWDLGIRGGYDRFFGVRDHVPLFATATLTVNLGLLFQPGADRRAIASREAWSKSQIEGPADRAVQVTASLSALRAEARTRLDATTALSAGLEQRHKALESVATDGARVAASIVWFALVHAKAEQAFFGALLAELEAALAGVT